MRFPSAWGKEESDRFLSFNATITWQTPVPLFAQLRNLRPTHRVLVSCATIFFSELTKLLGTFYVEKSQTAIIRQRLQLEQPSCERFEQFRTNY